ncbi:hypothetical protein HanXRQr2_Chr16g0731961 [Helianthus annuus]|uniref:Uncharacterized protein n=1 Tax=Helianthus annuus TaxID=4232 RepID=A0A9K3DQ01_HELAN|nr:hypothetical protein HanXRQr2_Chr16g0731961 [Helianthus annuus]KAJ0819946.1 hypothetical protein HanPSC8_Chr16g0701981 [Helianthus annuus]
MDIVFTVEIYQNHQARLEREVVCSLQVILWFSNATACIAQYGLVGRHVSAKWAACNRNKFSQNFTKELNIYQQPNQNNI